VSFALPIVFEQRVVLFPQGQVSAEQRDRCARLLLWCGGDVARVIDSPISSVEGFAEYLGRIKGIREGTEQVLVVLTRTNPLALTVVDARRRMEGRLSVLRTSRWVIYVDPEQDPFFEAMALRHGHLTGELWEAPLWVGPQDMPFLVLSPAVRERRQVCEGLEALDEAILSKSGERMAFRMGPVRDRG
jgi:hypothetical protein